MSKNDTKHIRALFDKAVDCAPEELDDFLNEQCAGNKLLRKKLGRLLSAHVSAQDFLEPPDTDDSIRQSESLSTLLSSSIPERIGNYRIHNKIAEGGMGIVYLAEQESPKRKVALKVLKPGIRAPELLKRFKQETEVLAWLQHPGIAKIYEAGTATIDNIVRPFFAMELIEGDTLTDYLVDNNPGTRARLEIMALICDAVHHAHQKGVIHRDLKPANILVDRAGRPKILDFGIARATDADIRTTTLETDAGKLVGTITYMSPEQISGRSSALDTRSDVYSLGVVMYETLTSKLPYDAAPESIAQTARLIEEADPISIGVIDYNFRGDIETIVMKALEKNKERRYQSASDLAADIRRYLSDQPITARPVTTVYQMRKFAKRNRSLVWAVACSFVLLCGGLIHVTLERNRAIRAEKLAEQRQAEAENARVSAEDQREKAEAISNFMQNVFASVDPINTQGREYSFRKVLDQTAKRIESELPDQPEVRAAVHHTLGKTFRNLGFLSESETHLQTAMNLRVELLGKEDEHTLATMNELALTLQQQGRLEEAENIFRTVMSVRQRVEGNVNDRTILAMNNLGWILLSKGLTTEAESLFRQSLEQRRGLSGEEHIETLRTMVNLAAALRQLGKLDEAEEYSRHALDDCKRLLGDRHPTTLYALRERVWLFVESNRFADAEQLGKESVALDREVYGDEHPNTLSAINNLAVILDNQDKRSEAEVMHRELLQTRRRVMGADHVDTVDSMNNLAVNLYMQKKLDDAGPLYTEVLKIRKRVLGDDHPKTLSAMYNLALLRRAQGNQNETESLFVLILQARRRLLGSDHTSTISVMKTLSDFYASQERFKEAEPLYIEILAYYQTNQGLDDPWTLAWTSSLARLRCRAGQHEEAIAMFADLIDHAREVLTEQHNFFGLFLQEYGECLNVANRKEEAETMMGSACETLAEQFGIENKKTQQCNKLLANIRGR